VISAQPAEPRIPPDARILDELRRLILARSEEMWETLSAAPRLLPRIDAALHERRLAADHSETATLAKLFLLAAPVALDDAAQALAPLGPETLVQTGLAALEEDVLLPLARVAPYSGVVVASDPVRPAHPPDVVTGPSPSARRVDRLTIRRPVRTALDLGTGSGVQALLAARHSERVVAVDLNERALVFARFNAALNGMSNFDTRKGSWFEPVEGERFDLIVANPPYVVSPETELLYRDGDLLADVVTQKLLQEAPAHLEEGGFAHVMGNWIHGRDDDWRAPVESWLAGTGCDALLLKYTGSDLVSYAALWNLPLAAGGIDLFLAAVDRWLDYYRRERIEAISEGMVVLRRRSGGPNWVRAIEVPGEPTGPAGDHLLRLFEARDRRDELAADDDVLAARFDLVPGLLVRWRAEGPDLGEKQARIQLENGVGFAAPMSAEVAELIASFDGSRRLGELALEDHESVATLRRLFALGLVSADKAP
jgi:methylase of polypeptide subunit release factors